MGGRPRAGEPRSPRPTDAAAPRRRWAHESVGRAGRGPVAGAGRAGADVLAAAACVPGTADPNQLPLLGAPSCPKCPWATVLLVPAAGAGGRFELWGQQRVVLARLGSATSAFGVGPWRREVAKGMFPEMPAISLIRWMDASRDAFRVSRSRAA